MFFSSFIFNNTYIKKHSERVFITKYSLNPFYTSLLPPSSIAILNWIKKLKNFLIFEFCNENVYSDIKLRPIFITYERWTTSYISSNSLYYLHVFIRSINKIKQSKTTFKFSLLCVIYFMYLSTPFYIKCTIFLIKSVNFILFIFF